MCRNIFQHNQIRKAASQNYKDLRSKKRYFLVYRMFLQPAKKACSTWKPYARGIFAEILRRSQGCVRVSNVLWYENQKSSNWDKNGEILTLECPFYRERVIVKSASDMFKFTSCLRFVSKCDLTPAIAMIIAMITIKIVKNTLCFFFITNSFATRNLDMEQRDCVYLYLHSGTNIKSFILFTILVQ